MTRHRVGALDALWIGEKVAITAGGVPLLLLRLEDGVRAWVDRCPHRGVKLSEGELDGGQLRCAAHGWTFDVRSGAGVNPESARLQPVAVTIADGVLYVELPGVEHPAPGAEPAVGPVLTAGPVAQAVLHAIRARNAEVSVLDRGSYLRVSCRRPCVVHRADVERALGTRFVFPGDLEQVMASFAGSFTVTDEVAQWS